MNLGWDAVAAIGAWVTPIATLFLIFWNRGNRPALKVTFDPETDVQTLVNVARADGQEKMSRWLRISVVNVGKRTAEKVRAYLVDATPPTDWPPGDVRALRWMHEHEKQPLPIDLPPMVRRKIDVVSARQDGENSLEVESYPTFVFMPGPRILTVQVVAEGGLSETIKIRVNFDGNWESLTGIHVSPRQL